MTLIDFVIKKGFEAKEAEAIIRSGKVMINQEVVFVPSEKIKETDAISIKEKKQ